ncbi:MAG: glycosyltransferase family 4 protein [Gaiellaceae bacterium]
MRVALVCPYSWSVPGGVQAHVAGLAAGLRALGHEVDVLAPADAPADAAGVAALGRTVGIPDNGSVQRVALSPAAVARTAALVRQRGYDLVHLHEPLIPAACLTALLAARVPVVGTFHMVGSSRRWYRVFGPLVRRWVTRLSQRIAVSHAAARYVAASLPGLYHVIPNGIDVEAFARLGARREGSRILFVGRPEPRKGLPVLLEAFSRLSGEPTLDLVGISTAELGALPPRVRAYGRVPAEERDRLLGEADVLCVPSLAAESFGVVLVEGMAAGLPVVASALDGYREALPEDCGRLVPPGDAVTLAAALGELLADEDVRRRLGDAGRQEAQRYDWPRVVERVLEVYGHAVRCHAQAVEA